MAKKKFGIGDIMNARSRVQAAAGTDKYEEIYLDPRDVKPSEGNFYSQENIEELADSFIAVGQQQPTVLGRVNGEFRIVSGHRRNLANILNIERGYGEYSRVRFLYRDMTPAMLELSLLMGNACNRELTAWEKTEQAGRLKKALIKAKEEDGLELPGKLRDVIAGLMDESSTNIARMDSINSNAAPEIKQEFAKGNLGISAAYEAAKLPPEEQRVIAKEAAEGNGIRAKEVAAKVAERAAGKERGAGQTEPQEKEGQQEKKPKPYERGCITGWSRYPDYCACCGYEGAECCSQCEESCNGRCGWVNDPYVREEEIPGQMHVEGFPELLPESGLCATSHIEDNDPTEKVFGMEEKPGKCLYRDGFFCSLSEEAKKTPGDGNDCGIKCCWKCTKQGCKLECHSSRTREDEAGQETEGAVADIKYQEVDNIVMACEEGAAETQQAEEKYEELCGLSDLELLQGKLDKEKRTLDMMLEEFTEKDRRVRLQKLIVGALAANICDLDNQQEPPKPVQPEFPILKNNDQRKEWLRDYKAWGLWYEDEHIGCKYYKYDFENGARLIAETYLVPESQYFAEHETCYLHLVGGLEPPKDKTGCYGKWQKHEKYNRFPNSETELVEFLKFAQRGK